MASPRRALMFLFVLCVAVGLGACDSEKDKKKKYAKCKAACVSQHLPDGQGDAPTVETALRRSQGGGPCLTLCGKILEPKDFMKKITTLFD